MTTQTKDFSSYVLPRGRVPRVLVDDVIVGPNEIGEAVLAYRNEAFRGRPNIEDTTQYAPGASLSFSNPPRVLFDNATLHRLTKDNARSLVTLLGPEQVIMGWEGIPNRPQTYADTDAMVVGSEPGVNEAHRKAVLSIIGGKHRSAKWPLLVRGLTDEPADTKDGFIFKGTDYMTVEDVPDWMRTTQRVRYDPEKKMIVPDEKGIQVYGVVHSGLGRVYRNGDDLNANWSNLVIACEAGRVQVAQAPKARSA